MKRFAVVLMTLCIAGAALGAETTTLQAWINTINTWVVSAKASIAGFTAKDAAQDGRLTTAEKASIDLAAANAQQDKRLTAAEGSIATLQAQMATLIAPPPPPPPPPVATVLWSAGMETGNLSEWPSQNNNSGAAVSSAVLASAVGIPAHGGLWVMQQSVTGASGGTRMGTDVVKLVQAGTEFWVTWWDYYPSKISFGPADMFMFLQIAGFDGVSYNPVWSFYLDGGNFTPRIGWSPNDMAPAAGPHIGEAGKRFYSTATPIPVGKWVLFELYVKPAADFTGALQLYMDRALIFDQSSIKTRYPGSGAPGVAGFMYLEHNAYGSGLTPTPATHYVDDVMISLGRIVTSAIISDVLTAGVSQCGIYLDSASKIAIPIAAVPEGNVCLYDLAGVTVGSHSIAMTAIAVNDPVWGSGESDRSLPLPFTVP